MTARPDPIVARLEQLEDGFIELVRDRVPKVGRGLVDQAEAARIARLIEIADAMIAARKDRREYAVPSPVGVERR